MKMKKVKAECMPPVNSIQNLLHRFSGFQTFNKHLLLRVSNM